MLSLRRIWSPAAVSHTCPGRPAIALLLLPVRIYACLIFSQVVPTAPTVQVVPFDCSTTDSFAAHTLLQSSITRSVVGIFFSDTSLGLYWSATLSTLHRTAKAARGLKLVTPFPHPCRLRFCPQRRPAQPGTFRARPAGSRTGASRWHSAPAAARRPAALESQIPSELAAISHSVSVFWHCAGGRDELLPNCCWGPI